jgi:hypothetical protein
MRYMHAAHPRDLGGYVADAELEESFAELLALVGSSRRAAWPQHQQREAHRLTWVDRRPPSSRHFDRAPPQILPIQHAGQDAVGCWRRKPDLAAKEVGGCGRLKIEEIELRVPARELRHPRHRVA